MKRISRLIWLIQEIRNEPKQELDSLLERAKISRSQFYKDRTALFDLGFKFEYKTGEGFRITEDRISPSLDLTVSERIVLMFALRHLYTSGEGHLAALALSAGKKLAGGLDEPFRSQAVEEFNQVVIKKGYGCDPEILESLEDAVRERRRIEVLYDSRHSQSEKWRIMDPLRLYFLQKVLYLYARDPDQAPKFRSFRVSRIRSIRRTGILFPEIIEDNFHQQLNNAFQYFMGDKSQEVTIRFEGKAAEYVKEGFWHHSQEIIPDGDDAIWFSVKVAEPKEVEWWARQFSSISDKEINHVDD